MPNWISQGSLQTRHNGCRAASKRFMEAPAFYILLPLIYGIWLLLDGKPMSRPIWINELRVMSGRIVPVSGGVCNDPSSKTKKMFIPPSSSTQRRSITSRKLPDRSLREDLPSAPQGWPHSCHRTWQRLFHLVQLSYNFPIPRVSPLRIRS